MKNCKKFYEAQIASRLKEIIQPSLTHSPNMKFWIIYILVQILFFWTTLGHFSQCFFIFRLWSNMVADIFTQPAPPP